MNADGNPLHEDIANYVYGGPGIFGSDSVGYMKSIHLNLTNLGTLYYLNYTGEEYTFTYYNGSTYSSGDRPDTPHHWLPVFDPDSAATLRGRTGNPAYPFAPLEGWALAYNITGSPRIYPTKPYDDSGYLAVTFSGFDPNTGYLEPEKLGIEEDDDWSLEVAVVETWVDNPRIVAIHYVFYAQNLASSFLPKFKIEMVIIFNKVKKFVEVFQKAKLVDITLGHCMAASIDIAFARMAIFDANAWCDRAFYGWKKVTIEDPEIFVVLSWTNDTLWKWTNVDNGWEDYAAYMAAYPVPNAYAIASTWFDSNDTDPYADAYNVWNATQLRYTPFKILVGGVPTTLGYLANYTLLFMGDRDGDGLGDGDQALVRVEWYVDVPSLPASEILARADTGWKVVVYGVYDVNGGEVDRETGAVKTPGYDGGEGGVFSIGELTLSNNKIYRAPDDPRNKVCIPGYTCGEDAFSLPSPYKHSGTLGYLNGYVTEDELTGRESQLVKYVFYIDIDQDGNKDYAENVDGDGVSSVDEYYIPLTWWPTEEFIGQLMYKFGPLTIGKIPPADCSRFAVEVYETWYGLFDFLVIPAPGATPDAAGAAWLNARYTAWMVMFDVEPQNMEATVGYVNPALKMLPYLMLRLEPLPAESEKYRPGPEWKSGRVGHYLTEDLRALPQMEWQDVADTDWRDVHYCVESIAGIHPNLVTYYFNDFSPILRATGGDYAWSIVVLPTVGPVDISPYVGTDMGLGVVSLVRDHFNNIALLVWGLDAQDTYWTAYWATLNWTAEIKPTYAEYQSILVGINYTSVCCGPDWGTGIGVPIAHPDYPCFIVIHAANEYSST